MPKFNCGFCGKEGHKPSGHINRSAKKGAGLYCNLTCSAQAKSLRQYRSPEQKIENKKIYDERYRAENRAMLAKKKADRHLLTYDPLKQREFNQARMKDHVEYCRRPEYRAKKKKYDRVYRAQRDYGEFWEASLIVQDIDNEVKTRMDNVELARAKGTLNKTKQRRRDYDRLNCNKS